MRFRIALFFLLGLAACTAPHTSQRVTKTFTNPLLPSGADPYSIYKDGYYYYTHTTGTNLTIWKAKNLTDLKTAEKKVVWTPPPSTMYSKQIWAPEIHFIDGKWYMYFAADDGNNVNHRMYVVQNSEADPLKGTWILKGKVADASDKWAIDGNLIQHKGVWYMAWSGWEGDVNGMQNIYIAKMENPWTISGERVKISSPDLPWERNGRLGDAYVYVNEGPQFLPYKNKLHIVYSANGCWTDDYSLGLLTADANADLLDPASWKKHPKPLFVKSPENGVHAPGHNSFFKSPDGREDWILYHANDKPGQGCGGHRSPRAQRFNWNRDGTPNFGKPIRPDVQLQSPST